VGKKGTRSGSAHKREKVGGKRWHHHEKYGRR